MLQTLLYFLLSNYHNEEKLLLSHLMNEINTVRDVWSWPELDIHNVRFISYLLLVEGHQLDLVLTQTSIRHPPLGNEESLPCDPVVGCKLYLLVGKNCTIKWREDTGKSQKYDLSKGFPQKKTGSWSLWCNVFRVFSPKWPCRLLEDEVKTKAEQGGRSGPCEAELPDLLPGKWCDSSSKHSHNDLPSIFTALDKWAF